MNAITRVASPKSWALPNPSIKRLLLVVRCRAGSSAESSSVLRSASILSSSGCSGAAPSFSTAASSMQAEKKSPIFCWTGVRAAPALADSSRMPQRNCWFSSANLP